MNEEQILNFVIGLVEVCDANLIEPGILKEMEIPESKHSIIIELRHIVEQILLDYSYLESPRFQSSIRGKSAGFQAMKRKFEDEPVKRSQHRKDLGAALSALMAGPEAYDLLTVEQHPLLDRIRILVNDLSDAPVV